MNSTPPNLGDWEGWMGPGDWGSLFHPDHVRHFAEWFAQLDDAEKPCVLEVR